METQNECTHDGNFCHESSTAEVLNDESITAKVRQALEEWNEQGRTTKLNKFRSAGAAAASTKPAAKVDH